MSLDLSTPGIARLGSWSAKISPVRFTILRLLVNANGRIVSRHEIADAVYGHRECVPAIPTNISYLRRSLKGSGVTIQAISRRGYCLRA